MITYFDVAKHVFDKNMFDNSIELLKNGAILEIELMWNSRMLEADAIVQDENIGAVRCSLTIFNSTQHRYSCQCPIEQSNLYCNHVLALFNFAYLLSKINKDFLSYATYYFDRDAKAYIRSGYYYDDDTTIKLSKFNINALYRERNKVLKYLESVKTPTLESSYSLKTFFENSQQIDTTNQSSVPDGSVELIQCIDFPKEQIDKPIFYLSFYIKAGRKYKIKNIPEFSEAVSNKEYYTFGKYLAFTLSPSMFDEKSKQIYQLIKGEERTAFKNLYYSYETKPVSRIECSCSMLPQILDPCIGDKIKIGSKSYNVVESNPEAEIRIKKYCKGLVIIHFPLFYNLFSAHES